MTLTKHLSQSDAPETSIVMRKIADLRPDPHNARIHQPRQIIYWLKVFSLLASMCLYSLMLRVTCWQGMDVCWLHRN
jgi:hypothetical protein